MLQYSCEAATTYSSQADVFQACFAASRAENQAAVRNISQIGLLACTGALALRFLYKATQGSMLLRALTTDPRLPGLHPKPWEQPQAMCLPYFMEQSMLRKLCPTVAPPVSCTKVVMLWPADRVFSGWISLHTSQASGPQPQANPLMNMQTCRPEVHLSQAV